MARHLFSASWSSDKMKEGVKWSTDAASMSHMLPSRCTSMTVIRWLQLVSSLWKARHSPQRGVGNDGGVLFHQCLVVTVAQVRDLAG